MPTLDEMTEQQGKKERPPPRTVLGAKGVDLVLVTYTDDRGTQYTQLCIVGDNQVHLMNGRTAGITRGDTPQGLANPWLRDAIMKKLGRKVE
jgi:hypothetical protein